MPPKTTVDDIKKILMAGGEPTPEEWNGAGIEVEDTRAEYRKKYKGKGKEGPTSDAETNQKKAEETWGRISDVKAPAWESTMERLKGFTARGPSLPEQYREFSEKEAANIRAGKEPSRKEQLEQYADVAIPSKTLIDKEAKDDPEKLREWIPVLGKIIEYESGRFLTGTQGKTSNILGDIGRKIAWGLTVEPVAGVRSGTDRRNTAYFDLSANEPSKVLSGWNWGAWTKRAQEAAVAVAHINSVLATPGGSTTETPQQQEQLHQAFPSAVREKEAQAKADWEEVKKLIYMVDTATTDADYNAKLARYEEFIKSLGKERDSAAREYGRKVTYGE